MKWTPYFTSAPLILQPHEYYSEFLTHAHTIRQSLRAFIPDRNPTTPFWWVLDVSMLHNLCDLRVWNPCVGNSPLACSWAHYGLTGLMYSPSFQLRFKEALWWLSRETDLCFTKTRFTGLSRHLCLKYMFKYRWLQR